MHDDVIKWKHFPRYWLFCAWNSPVSGEFPSQRPVTRSFDVFFDLHLNKRLSNDNRDAGDLRRQVPMARSWDVNTRSIGSMKVYGSNPLQVEQNQEAGLPRHFHVKILDSYWAFSNLASDWLTAEPLANQKATLENHCWLTWNLTWIFVIIQVPDSSCPVTDTSFEAWTGHAGSSLVQVMAS